MIKEIFLPNTINGYYLFPVRIVGFDVGKTHISATQIYMTGKKTIIEKYLETPLDQGSASNYAERVSNALKTIMLQLDTCDRVHTAISSSVVIFKELRLPFLNYEKIKMVLNYEVELLLPFPIQDACVDFIITKQYPDLGSSEVLVAAVQNNFIAEHLQLFTDAGISPDVVTVDLFALYGFYKKLPVYAATTSDVTFIDLGMQTTRIAYVQDGKLRFIRTINKGLGQSDTLESKLFWQEIQLTLQSFKAQAQNNTANTRIMLLGNGAEIKGIADVASQQLGMPCELMRANSLLHDSTITIKNDIPLPSSSIISLSTALPSPITQHFNLRQGIFALPIASLFNKQLLVACCLILLCIGSLGTYSFLQIRAMRNEAVASEKEALASLTERKDFERVLQEELKGTSEKNKLEDAKDIAQSAVKKLEEMWFAFTGSARSSMLQYLLELSNRIDRDGLGFDIESLTISEGTMTIKAHVKNHEALKILEKELKQSKLFSYVPTQEETNFTMKIILAKNGEGQS
ncbi:MAG: pilus assembly protein PilM [Candidatus Dependentiae bacterium]|nr:pilus assembly protein PilM [Candidatus Dependentiae bacterium]